MRLPTLARGLACCYFSSIALSSFGAPVVGGTGDLPVEAIQRVILPVGSPLNGSGQEVDLGDVSALGAWSFQRQAQQGTTIQFTDGSFFGRGTLAGVGGFDLIGGVPFGFGEITATLSNVVQDPNDPGFATGDPSSITSGDLLIQVPNYGIQFDNGVDLEIRDPFIFNSSFDGLPPSLGTLYESNPLDQQLTAYIAGTNTIAAISTDRRLFAIPEPAAWILCGLSLLARGVRRRRRAPLS